MDHSIAEADGESSTVPTNGVDTHYVRRGEGPAIVFVHGAIMDGRMWEPQLDALADEFTVVAYDVRGHGRTGWSDADPYTMDLFADDLHALVEALDLDRPVICGLSMGGAIAQAYAVRYPDDCSGLVLADTFTPGRLGLGGRLLFGNLRLIAALSRFVSYKRLNWAQIVLGERIAPGIAGDARRIQRLVDEGPTMSHAELTKVIRALRAFPHSDLDVSRIDVPTLVLYGEHEPAPMRTQARRIAASIPGAELRNLTEIPEAGHASSLDAPEVVVGAVREIAEAAFGSTAEE